MVARHRREISTRQTSTSLRICGVHRSSPFQRRLVKLRPGTEAAGAPRRARNRQGSRAARTRVCPWRAAGGCCPHRPPPALRTARTSDLHVKEQGGLRSEHRLLVRLAHVRVAHVVPREGEGEGGVTAEQSVSGGGVSRNRLGSAGASRRWLGSVPACQGREGQMSR